MQATEPTPFKVRMFAASGTRQMKSREAKRVLCGFYIQVQDNFVLADLTKVWKESRRKENIGYNRAETQSSLVIANK